MLFEKAETKNFELRQKPLADKLRPESFHQLKGQKIWDQGSPLRSLIEKDLFFSLIFWGPPGSGKTSLAHLIGKHSKRPLLFLSAVNAGVQDIRAVINKSQTALKNGNKASVLFLDEIHRLSKNQQDVLLPSLEEGSIKFIGATTENPSFTVNNAINSRSLVFKFEALAADALVQILNQAMQSLSSSLKEITVTAPVLQAIAKSSVGDARRALNLLEALLNSSHGEKIIDLTALEQLSTNLPLNYDKQGDLHYDFTSAMIKSIRASHPDAALFYLARLLAGGEDPMFVARRLLISASEDIGNANPHALSFANAGVNAVKMLGMPEARIILGQICTLLASSPKSNRSYQAINLALDAVKKYPDSEVPLHLRNASSELMSSLGYGKSYVSPHERLEDAKKLNYLPDDLKEEKFYQPSDSGFEANIQQTLARLKPLQS